jgi:hypothetical protein
MKNHPKKRAFFQRLFSTIPPKFVCQSLFLLFSYSPTTAFSQDGWKLGLGNSVTRYKFFDSKGAPITFLKQGSGNSIFISKESAVIDTSSFIGQTTERAVYFLNHELLTKLLTHVTYELGLNFNQYNSVGDIQKIPVNYQTNYLGILAGAGPYSHVLNGFYLSIKANISLQKIVQGTQQLNNQFVDLMDEPEFNRVMIFLGYSATLTKNLANGLSLFVQAQQSQSYHKWVEGQENLNFSAVNFSFGLKIGK